MYVKKTSRYTCLIETQTFLPEHVIKSPAGLQLNSSAPPYTSLIRSTLHSTVYTLQYF